ncbi:hypothetical protein CC86DRAFT_71098 [Ophiobolus disseminans]|uniref:Uncharacterized protein n=1 Tax=Ophiobolus disseminans TaxID=1469910 RepID=A0A6A6ZNU6_9PLEO|nr:hypothetical protein CC86DRAFT_71098 [Ophiobolus disseminans]
MKRIDSGFHESFHSHGLLLMGRSNTAPSRRQVSKKSTVDAASPVFSMGPVSQRPASEKRSRPVHQRSKTSPSETSTTRSKGHGHESKPSSRRTSCTIVDPSRSRHYRMQSSNTVPTASRRDIDDVYALHHRSYSMFQNPSLHTRSGLPSPTLSNTDKFGFPCTSPRFSVDEALMMQQCELPKKSEGTTATADKVATTMHWTSPCTRRREYDRIDKANSGLRGFMNRIMPRCVSGPPEKFYEKDQSDTGSVRRYRIEDGERNERERARLQTESMQTHLGTKKRWICF